MRTAEIQKATNYMMCCQNCMCMKQILCFGDSNTYGLIPGTENRYNWEIRWTGRLDAAVRGKGYRVIEEGLCGRTTVFEDPLREGRRGTALLGTVLESHKPLELVILMLGTNDCKDRFCSSAACIGLGMARLVNKAKSTDCWGGKTPNILVIAPPPIGEGMLTSAVAATMGKLCVEKSRQLADSYREQCELLNVSFLDAGAIGCEFNTVDFMHLTSRGHRTLAEALAKLIPQLLR